jgi:hypothetical protein
VSDRYRNQGGRIAPDNRPAQAPGVGKNSKRHDLERRNTPFLHGSDLQQGDIQAMEQGQRIAPVQTQQPAAPRPAPAGGSTASTTGTGPGMAVPDPIAFIGERAGGTLTPPASGVHVDNSKALTWLPLVRQLAAGPGSSPMLASAFINQARNLRKMGHMPAAIIDLDGVDDAIEAMLGEL